MQELKARDAETAELSAAERLANQYILWGAGRAAAIAMAPIPLADVGPLMANEAYMIYRVAQAYGYAADKSVVAMFAGMAGGSLAGRMAASLIPFMKIPIAAGITFAVGKTAKAYFASGMTLSKEELQREFLSARKEADGMEWNEHVVEKEEDENEDEDEEKG